MASDRKHRLFELCGYAAYTEVLFRTCLSYTKFEYSNLQLSKDCIMPTESIRIQCDVENTGEYKGDEVVQLYLKDIHASMARPVKELAGFKRIR